MSVENPTFKVESLETPLAAGQVINFLQTCVAYSENPKTQSLPQNLLGHLIFQVEEEDIVALKNPDSPQYKKVEATMRPIMESLQCNVIVIVGHNEICFQYIRNTLLTSSNSLPTIVLMVACYSWQVVEEFNKKPQYRAGNFYFFGFTLLMHLMDGEIFICKEGHVALPFLDCRFGKVLEDVQKIKANATLYNKPYNEKLELLKCCEARYEHFKHKFYEYLDKRLCSKFPTESLLAKLKIIRNADGSLLDMNSIDFYKKEDKDKFLFDYEDGVECKAGQSCANHPTKYSLYKNNNEKFTDRVKYGEDTNKTVFIKILQDYPNVTEKMHAENDQKMASLLKSLPSGKAKEILTSQFKGDLFLIGESDSIPEVALKLPLYFRILLQNYKLTVQEILKLKDLQFSESLDFIFVRHEYYNILSLLQLYINYNDTHPFVHTNESGSYSKPKLFYLTEKEVLRLFSFLQKKVPALFTISTYQTSVQEYPNYIFNLVFTKYCHMPMIEYLFKYCRDFIQNESIFPYKMLQNEFGHWSQEEIFKVYELLAVFGKLRKDNYIDRFFWTYAARTSNTYRMNPVSLIFIYVYLHNDTAYPDSRIQTKINALTRKVDDVKPYMKPKIRRLLKTFTQVFDFFGNNEATPITLRKTPEEMLKKIDFDLREYEAGIVAVDEIVEYFGKIQPQIQSRKNLDAKQKQDAIKSLVDIYRDIKVDKNQGDNAVRRLQALHSAYNTFLARNNVPKRNNRKQFPIKLPNIASQGEDSIWLVDQYAIYLARPKPKKTPVRRTRKAKNTGSAAVENVAQNAAGAGAGPRPMERVQQDLAEAVERLQHLEENLARMRNPAVAPRRVVNPENNTNNNQAALPPVVFRPVLDPENNNQAGGRRTNTRKLRR